ncbi:tRNA-dihydrouridine(47) synthase [NAD(P)(+)]-like [Populus alba]|uniref:tRNA-dihydrouridine(47) synthase [NAD(P)(+)] n=1 Tax=Populus alba TaxID=43335 RepID=A0A4U5PK46_POPAL|nr:tRNA-dihydrouridine(47) synthase [NAD(P)(+)]-like [Populus alba]TKR97039.1 dihydrouridine synthase family protein [Populus alba]
MGCPIDIVVSKGAGSSLLTKPMRMKIIIEAAPALDFTEIKEQRRWDISSGERLNILKDYVRSSLEHWGSDTEAETTRHFLLEWLSYTCRYVLVGLLDVIPDGSTCGTET